MIRAAHRASAPVLMTLLLLGLTTATSLPPAYAADTIVPTVAVTQPTAGATVSAGEVTLAGTASDDTGVTAAYVQVRNNATNLWLRADGTWASGASRLVAPLTTAGARSTGWRYSTVLGPGSYGFDVVARDAAGNWSAKPWRTFTVAATAPDTTAPAVTVTAPSAGAQVDGPSVTLAGTASDNRGVTAAYVQVRDDASGLWLRADGSWAPGASRIAATLGSAGAASTSWSFSNALRAGRYGFDVIARDAAANWSTKPWTPFVVRASSPSRVVMTPTTSPETSQSFSWLAGGAETSSLLQVQPVSGGVERTLGATPVGTINGNPRQHFSVTVGDLAPATAYRYRVGGPDGWSEWFMFTTADPAHPDFSFVYYGDAQLGLATTWRRVVQAATAKAPGAIGSLHAGDLINDADDESQWMSWFDGMGSAASTRNVIAAPGNHEYLGDQLLRAWKATFQYPLNHPSRATIGDLAGLAEGDTEVARQYAAYFDHFTALAGETAYYTDYQDVRFVTLNASREIGFLTPADLPPCVGNAADPCPSSFPGELWIRFQAAWLDQVLAASQATWHVVTFHQPVYSAAVGRDEPILRRHWVPVLEEHDVDLVLMGHDHVYARGYRDTSATGTPGLTSGPVYVVSNAGAQYYALQTDPTKNVWLTNGATQVRTGQQVTTYQVIDVTGETLSYRSWLVEKGSGSSTGLPPGALFDEFTVTRTADGRRWVTEPGVPVPTPQP